MTFSQSSEPFSVQLGDKLPQREFKPDNVQLFLYNAILWNAHRIHFDETYTTEVEGYPGLVIAGPMIGDWLHQCVEDWLGEEGRLVSMEYSNRSIGIQSWGRPLQPQPVSRFAANQRWLACELL